MESEVFLGRTDHIESIMKAHTDADLVSPRPGTHCDVGAFIKPDVDVAISGVIIWHEHLVLMPYTSRYDVRGGQCTYSDHSGHHTSSFEIIGLG